MIDFDEMKAKWAKQDRKLEENLHLNRNVLRAVHLAEGRSKLRPLMFFASVHTAAWFALVVLLGDFVYSHKGEPRFALAGAAVDLYAIGMLAVLIRQLLMMAQIDYTQPVIAIQRKLEALRVLRIRATQWAVLAGMVIWIPFLIVVLKALAGLDAYRMFDKAWLIVNVLFGLALIPASIWISKRFGERLDNSPFVQQILNDLAGRNLNAATRFLSELAEFERMA